MEAAEVAVEIPLGRDDGTTVVTTVGAVKRKVRVDLPKNEISLRV
jgi:hypothetical protein